MLARLLPSLGSARLGQCRARQHGASVVRVNMSTYRLPRGATLHLKEGDLTEFDGGAIVNAANEQMLGGGGVDGAIHRAAGRELYDLCKKVPEVSPGVRCNTGSAQVTKGARLPADYVIHTVGPIYDAYPHEEAEQLLESCHRQVMRVANEVKLDSIAFCAISCGVYGYPPDKAAKVALKTTAAHVGNVKDVHFILFNNKFFSIFDAEAKQQFEAA